MPIQSVPVRVYYAPRGERVSHFRKFRDFGRTSILNAVLVIMALLWVRPFMYLNTLRKKSIKGFFRELILESKDSNLKLALSVGLGTFFSIFPVWGWQMVTAVAIAYLLRLNKLVTLAFSNLSIAPVIPFILYLSDRAAEEAAQTPSAGSTPGGRYPETNDRRARSMDPARSMRTAIRDPLPNPPTPARDLSADSLAKIQSSYQKMIDLVVKELDAQAHFVGYAPPAVIAFRKAAYLEFSVNTSLPADPDSSRYKLAALAFDNHIAKLVRPMMAYFKGDLDFDGIAFSTTIHQGDKADAAQGNEAVEFFFPVDSLRCYETYDCTGQQLIDQGSVLINGERVSLDLQTAEASER